MESVTGTNGILIPPEGYIQGVRALCDKYGIVMIADEVMSGFGRTGKWFAVDNWNVVPDIMTMAKGLGKGRWEVFAPSMHVAVLSRHEFKADLHRALPRDELIVQYQPIFEVPSHEVVAAEALLRRRHPRHGLVQPVDFIPLAEETGLIAPIGL